METQTAFTKKCEDYAERHGIRDLMRSLARLLVIQQPDDPLQCLIDHLKQQQQLESQEAQQQQPHQKEEAPFRLVMLGLPGSGRRELSRRLADMCDLPLVSAGDLLRLHAEKFPNGEAALALTSKTLARDELVIDLITKRLEQQQLEHAAHSSWILDGFPRTRTQAVALLQLRLFPERCCLLLPGEQRAKAAVRAAAAAAAAARTESARSMEGPQFFISTTPESERRARLQLTREADERLQSAYAHAERVLEVLGPLAETVPADSSQELVLDILKARCGIEGDSWIRRLPPKLCILGCSGSGKSTQSRLISNRFGVVHVDVRKLLLQRAHEDEACRQALMELEAGLESSFEPMLGQLVADRLEAADCARRGWVLEGFPETAQQVDLLRQHRIAPDGIVFLEVPESSYTANVDSCGGANEARKDAARLVEMRLAQIKRWIPFVQQAFPDKFTTIWKVWIIWHKTNCKPLHTLKALGMFYSDQLNNVADVEKATYEGPPFSLGPPCRSLSAGVPLRQSQLLSAHPNASTLTCTSSTNNGAAGSAFLHRTSPSAAAAVPAASSEGEDAAATAASKVDVALVKKLRQLTAAGYGSCLKALQHSNGDLPMAVKWLRHQGAADAAAAVAAATAAASSVRPGDDTQKEGVIALCRIETKLTPAPEGGALDTSASIERIAAVHVACRTDFVSRSEVFTAAASRTAAAACMSACFAKEAAAAAGVPGAGTRTSQQQKLLQQLLSLPTGYSFPAGVPSDAEGEAAATVGADLAYTSRLVGETVVVKRVAMREALRGSGIVAFYCHQPVAANVAPLAVLLHLSYSRQEKQQEDQAEFEGHLRRFGKQLCMQIAAAKPLAVRVEDLPPAIVAQEQQYALSSLSSKGGSNAKCLTDAFKQKIVEGKMNKWHKEVVLLKQPWALDDSGRSTEKVLKDTEQLLKIKVSIDGFDLLEVASGS
ncbi:uncharacterized protein LOC34619981 [Cyclospora cayetanensis]|uniref:Elongation factor Ts, mitochondrial n=1 Tax=Cyclospora cayetanensis TaxID=88456 RepID=A0A6P6RWA6_9EIME|nr:uncharacterized protein LOC34619981 [Cyclospora cayetanensis]